MYPDQDFAGAIVVWRVYFKAQNWTAPSLAATMPPVPVIFVTLRCRGLCAWRAIVFETGSGRDWIRVAEMDAQLDLSASVVGDSHFGIPVLQVHRRNVVNYGVVEVPLGLGAQSGHDLHGLLIVVRCLEGV